MEIHMSRPQPVEEQNRRDRRMGLKVFAEGVGTEEARTILENPGCDGMQGFLFGRPVAGADVSRLLRRGVKNTL